MMQAHLKKITYIGLTIGVLVLFYYSVIDTNRNWEVKKTNTVKIGLLYAQTGDWTITQKSIHDAIAMTIEEINNDGGLLGRQIEMVAIDNESNDMSYNSNLSKLFDEQKVKTLFCYVPKKTINSKIRYTQSDKLVFDLADYNSVEKNRYVIKLGSTPNQLLYPGIDYLFQNKKDLFTNFIIIGTKDVYSIEANQLLKKYLLEKKVSPQNIHLKVLDIEKDNTTETIIEVKKIVSKGKTCILNTMKGSANLALFKEFTNQGLSSLSCPIMSFTISEEELKAMSAEFNIGHYFCRNYFQSLEAEKNIRFVSDFKLFSAINELPDGMDRVTSEEISRIYNGVFLWKKAVELAQTFEPEALIKKLAGLTFNSPAGILKINEKLLTLNKPAIVAESNIDGQMTVLWESKTQLPPFK